MHKPYVINRHLNEHWRAESNEYMARKIQNAKPEVNMQCPESFYFYKNEIHRNIIKTSKSKNFLYKKNNFSKRIRNIKRQHIFI